MADADDSEQIALKDVPTTLADHVAFLTYATRRPSRLAIQVAIFLAVGLMFVGFEIVIGILSAMFTAQHGLGEAAWRYLTRGIGPDLAGSWQVTAGIVVAIFLLNVLVMTPLQCRRIAAKLIAAYPESASGRPTPTLVSQVRLDARGAQTATRNERVFLAWPSFTRLAETSRYLYLMNGGSAALIFPKAAIAADDIARVRTICRRALAASRPPA